LYLARRTQSTPLIFPKTRASEGYNSIQFNILTTYQYQDYYSHYNHDDTDDNDSDCKNADDCENDADDSN